MAVYAKQMFSVVYLMMTHTIMWRNIIDKQEYSLLHIEVLRAIIVTMYDNGYVDLVNSYTKLTYFLSYWGLLLRYDTYTFEARIPLGNSAQLWGYIPHSRWKLHTALVFCHPTKISCQQSMASSLEQQNFLQGYVLSRVSLSFCDPLSS